MAASVPKLPGELVVAQAHKARYILRYTNSQEPSRGVAIPGTLTCTNFCFHFEPEITPGQTLGHYGSCQLASCKHVPLGCVKELYMIVGGRKKVLEGHATLPKKISDIEIICTDLRHLLFSVKQCVKNEASSILNALARHTHPSSVSLLFAFDYARATKNNRPTQSNDAAPLFLNVRDWQKELTRLGVASNQWRISEANKEFLICDSLCPFIVVPENARDETLDYVASLHHGNRLPVWCWSHPNTGVSLTRGGAPSIDDQSEAPDPNYMYAVSMARNLGHQIENKRPVIMDVTKACGTIFDLRTAFSHMRDVCLPDSSQELAGLDKKWLGWLDTAGWVPMVRKCLHLAKRAVKTMCIEHTPVFLQEDGGRDIVCVVTSLAQLMMDPHFRSIPGFQCLVQKEWVALGHPFTTRHHLISPQSSPSVEGASEETPVEAPAFLLFLDCVWQLTLQFPSAFEFSEFYLLKLHNLSYNCLFGTFIFNSPKARLQASLMSRNSHFFGSDEGVANDTDNYEGLLASAWDNWRDTLSQEEREHCLNPLYYVFGSSEARYDFNTSDPLPMYNHFNSIFDDMTPNLVVGGSYGLYSRQSPMRDLHVSLVAKDHHYQLGLLLPETSSCTIRPWLGFFSRYIPEFHDHLRERRRTQEREATLVKDVRRLKDTLNELELSVGTMTSDLTSFIGAILAAREMEKCTRMMNLSPEINPASRPRLSAVVYEGQEERDKRNAELSKTSKTLPSEIKSLAEFTETLYSFTEENSRSPSRLKRAEDGSRAGASPSLSTGSGRSPITKTRLRVTRTVSTEQSGLHSRWGGSPGPASGHVPLLPNKILIKERSVSLEEEEEGGGRCREERREERGKVEKEGERRDNKDTTYI